MTDPSVRLPRLWRALAALNWFVPPGRQDGGDLQRKSQLFVGLLLLVLAVIPPNMASQIQLQMWPQFMIGLISVVYHAVLLFVYRRIDRHTLIVQLTLAYGALAIFTTAIVSGGLYSIVVPYLTLFPLLGWTMANRRIALHWCIIVGFLINILAGLSVLFPAVENGLFVTVEPTGWTINLLGQLSWVSICLWFADSANSLQRDALRQESTLANQANQAKTEFLSNMSHELRTPINGVLGLTELVLADETLDRTHRERLTMALQSGRSMVTLLNELLDLAKVEAGRLKLEFLPFSPTQIAQEVHQLFSSEDIPSVELSLQVASDVPPWVSGDPTRVRQVLINLVGNAVKFTKQGSIAVTVSVNSEDQLCFIVSDTGPGIPAHLCQSIFEPFSQADSSTARRHGGSGLGLAISRQLAELMGGSLHLSSATGIGSDFQLTIPLVRSASPSAMTQSIPPTPVVAADAPRILLVEDNQVNQVVAASILRRLGCIVTIVDEGPTALSCLRTDPFDLVLMDWHLPGLDGITITQTVRSENIRVPIIGLTARASAADRQVALEAGMDDVIGKPFSLSEFTAVVTQHLPEEQNTRVASQ